MEEKAGESFGPNDGRGRPWRAERPYKTRAPLRAGLGVLGDSNGLERVKLVRPFYDRLRAARWRGERSLDLLKRSADAVATSREGHRSPI
jgi:hypothetical protein